MLTLAAHPPPPFLDSFSWLLFFPSFPSYSPVSFPIPHSVFFFFTIFLCPLHEKLLISLSIFFSTIHIFLLSTSSMVFFFNTTKPSLFVFLPPPLSLPLPPLISHPSFPSPIPLSSPSLLPLSPCQHLSPWSFFTSFLQSDTFFLCLSFRPVFHIFIASHTAYHLFSPCFFSFNICFPFSRSLSLAAFSVRSTFFFRLSSSPFHTSFSSFPMRSFSSHSLFSSSRFLLFLRPWVTRWKEERPRQNTQEVGEKEGEIAKR